MILSKIPEILCDRTGAIDPWLKNLRLGRTWQLSSQCLTAGLQLYNQNKCPTLRHFPKGGFSIADACPMNCRRIAEKPCWTRHSQQFITTGHIPPKSSILRAASPPEQ